MNADNFAQYLENPSLLYQASYQELKSLALQYPYCQNLHLLLFQKSFMEGSREWEQNLEKAAAYSIDRKHLYYTVRKLDKKAAGADNFLLSEEFLELKSLEGLRMEEQLLQDTGAGKQEEEPVLHLEFGPAEETPGPKEPLPGVMDDEDEPDELFETNAGLAPREEDTPFPENESEAGMAEQASDELPASLADASEPAPQPFEVEQELVGALSTLLHILELRETGSPPLPSRKKAKERKTGRRPPLPSPELDVLKQKTRQRPVFTVDQQAEPPKPQPKQSFTSWLEKFQAPNVQERLNELMESKKLEDAKKRRKRNKKNKKAKANTPGVGRLAIRSITENKEILSETLAELLASQGEYHRAMEMYRALMLVFPQKSDYFAEKIENLKRT